MNPVFTQAESVGDIKSKIGPGHLALVSQMPNAGFAVEQEIQNRVDKMGHIGWRDRNILSDGHGLIAKQVAYHMMNEIILVPRTEEGAGPDYERGVQASTNGGFEPSLAGAINIERIGLVAF